MKIADYLEIGLQFFKRQLEIQEGSPLWRDDNVLPPLDVRVPLGLLPNDIQDLAAQTGISISSGKRSRSDSK